MSLDFVRRLLEHLILHRVNLVILECAAEDGDPRYRRALFYLRACETSCYRYWGQGIWTDYGAELARRACETASSAA